MDQMYFYHILSGHKHITSVSCVKEDTGNPEVEFLLKNLNIWKNIISIHCECGSKCLSISKLIVGSFTKDSGKCWVSTSNQCSETFIRLLQPPN